MSVIQEVINAGSVRLCDYIVGDSIGDIRRCAGIRPFLQNLRIASVVVGIAQENLRYLVLLGLAAVRRIVAAPLDFDASVVVGGLYQDV